MWKLGFDSREIPPPRHKASSLCDANLQMIVNCLLLLSLTGGHARIKKKECLRALEKISPLAYPLTHKV